MGFLPSSPFNSWIRKSFMNHHKCFSKHPKASGKKVLPHSTQKTKQIKLFIYFRRENNLKCDMLTSEYGVRVRFIFRQ